MTSRIGLVLALALVALTGCRRAALETSPTETHAEPSPLDAPHLPNAHRLHDKVISGGQPDGEAAFRELQALGVKTIISVDGAKPNVEQARRFGMRYVHLPHGYDGIPDGRVVELAKAVRDFEGPIYIHCHHGKHRSPAAAAVACVAAGLIDARDAEPVLRTAGTSENYRGLYHAARHARRIPDDRLNNTKVEFPEIASLPALAESMVAIEHAVDRVKLVARAGWRASNQHPDLDPRHEMLILREQFTELLRDPVLSQHPPRFRELLRACEDAARDLEHHLSTHDLPERITSVNDRWTTLNRLCITCHREFRDIPLNEKPAR